MVVSFKEQKIQINMLEGCVEGAKYKASKLCAGEWWRFSYGPTKSAASAKSDASEAAPSAVIRVGYGAFFGEQALCTSNDLDSLEHGVGPPNFVPMGNCPSPWFFSLNARFHSLCIP